MVSNHYNAFISYRHCEPDATVASRIQKQLERFRIPSAIAKKTGMKKIDRVFRDKEELPLCNNLGDDIESALENSDYLILICSPRTKESLWVAREVELFLQKHSVDKVLTVLVEGEPQDVLPPILLKDREPLSCDYRISPKKAKRDELPRLAAAILNCRYDELRQRQKQYQMRRRMAFLTALLVLALGLSAYTFYTNRQIRHHYNEQLKSQSNYLAAESLQLLQAGDRLSALELALYALEGERPWVPNAEYALGCAIGAYTSEDTLRSVRSLKHSATVMDFFTTADEAYLLSWDQSYALYVRDIKTGELLQRISLKGRPQQVCELPDNRVVIYGSGELACYSFLTGELLWTNAENAGDFIYENGVFAVDGILDIDTGKVEEIEDDLLWKTPLCVSEDGNLIAYKTHTDELDYEILIYDRSRQEFVTTGICPEYIEHAKFYGEKLIVLCDMELGESEHWNLDEGFIVIRRGTQDLFCFDAKTAQTLWHTELPHHLVSYASFLVLQETAAMVFLSNLCFAVDLASGEILHQIQFTDSIVSVDVREKGIGCFLKNGYFTNYRFGDTETSNVRYFPEHVQKGTVKGGNFVLTDASTQIVQYDFVADEDLVIVDSPEATRLTVCAENESYALFLADYSGTVLCYRMQPEPELLWQQALTDNCIGMSGNEAYFYDSYEKQLIRCRLQDGSVEREDLLPTVEYGYSSLVNAPVLLGESIAFVRFDQDFSAQDSNSYILCIRTLDGIQTEYPVPQTAGLERRYAGSVHLAAADDASGLIVTLSENNADWSAKNHAVWHFDLQKFTELSTFSTGTSFRNLSVYEHGRLLIADAGGVTVFNKNLTQAGRLEMPIPAFSACFEGDRLYLLDEDSTLYFCTTDGALEHKESMYYYNGKIASYSNVRWHTGEPLLAVQIDSICNVIDPQSKTVFAYVPSCSFYSPISDRFYITVSDNGCHLGYFPRYSTEDLIEKAREILGENEMPAEQRELYGLQ